MMDFSSAYNQGSVSEDYAYKSLKTSQFLQDLGNHSLKYPSSGPYDAIILILD